MLHPSDSESAGIVLFHKVMSSLADVSLPQRRKFLREFLPAMNHDPKAVMEKMAEMGREYLQKWGEDVKPVPPIRDAWDVLADESFSV